MDENGIISTVLDLIAGNATITAAIGLITAVLGSGVFSFLRRPGKVSQGEADYLSEEKLLAAPIERPAYSDRMAYVLAELSALAYYEFEGVGGRISDAAKHLAKIATGGEEQVGKWLESFASQLLIDGVDSEEFLRKILESRDFELLGTVNVVETQALVCKRLPKDPGENPYVAVAFRGTEKKVSDWLTDADAVPTIVDEIIRSEGTKPGMVHTGFLNALTVNTDHQGETALERVQAILDEKGMDDDGKPLPLFITGHSLGGALALLTTVLIAREVYGACYTYGAPRIANYECFENLKTPVFRVVNSADIVPRVPPIMVVWVKLAQGLAWLTSFFRPVSDLFERLANWLDRLKGYRHYGDQRYLTDVKSGRFSDVKLLSNPPAVDRIMWAGQQLVQSWFSPIKSHGMNIYRNKLRCLANERNQPT
jgi:hypothetical protein